MQFFELLLHRAVLAVGAVQGQKNHIGFRRQSPAGLNWIQLVGDVAERTQGFGDCRAGAQRDFALGRRWPPSMMVMFNDSGNVFSHYFHLGPQFNAPFRPGAGLNCFDQLQNVTGGGVAIIDNKISMHGRNLGPALLRAFSSRVPRSTLPCRQSRGVGF